ncbi:phosphoribosyltransferase family protein [Halobellus sp. GM3]|uniref:phosphoribosyltransferase family protein n=1 Tax=Halobellus sp. GM3 TaxID=3458410 RepID=UPI00403E24FA
MDGADTYDCPVTGCGYAGDLDAVLAHVDTVANPAHSWAALGYSDAAEYERIARSERDANRTDDGKIRPSPLSELYEAFRGIRTAVSATLEADSSEIDPDDRSNPLVQYREVLGAFCGTTEHESGDILGYGPQHVDRVDHRVADYREHYGNGDWITAFQCIEVEPLSEAVRATLSSYDRVDNPALLVRPTTPRTGIPVPELVRTRGELARALSILARFPSEPPVERGEETQSSTFPVKTVHEAVLSETAIDPVEADLTRVYDRARTSVSGAPQSTTPHWRESPAALASPQSPAEIEAFLTRYGKLTHLYQRVDPPAETPVDESLPVFALDFYDPVSRTANPSQHSFRILSFAKQHDDRFRGHFLNRVRDFLYQRVLRDSLEYDYLTVYPGHRAQSLSPALVELATQATVETPIVYSELLERTETTEKQREKGQRSRWDVARRPAETLTVRHQLSGDRVIVLDDIATSGSSLCAAAHLLRRAGASDVIGLTLGFTRSQNAERASEITDRERRLSDIRTDHQ